MATQRWEQTLLNRVRHRLHLGWQLYLLLEQLEVVDIRIAVRVDTASHWVTCAPDRVETQAPGTLALRPKEPYDVVVALVMLELVNIFNCIDDSYRLLLSHIRLRSNVCRLVAQHHIDKPS